MAHSLLALFVSHCKEIYHLDFLVYNIHALIHLADDAKLYGSLNNISAFPFENYLGQLKKLVRAPKLPLQQLFCRLTELNNRNMVCENLQEVQIYSEHFNGPESPDHPNCKQFEQIIYKKIKFAIHKRSKPNSYFLTNDNHVVQINNILLNNEEKLFLIGKEFMSYSSLYTYPVDSKLLQIFLVSSLLENKVWQLSNI